MRLVAVRPACRGVSCTLDAEIVEAILRGDERTAAAHMVHDIDRDEALYRHLAPMREVGSG